MDNILTIWCFIEGGTRPFSIDISGKLVIDGLADAIYSKREIRRSIELLLYKPKDKIALKPSKSLSERIPQDDQLFDLLKPVDTVSDCYPTLEPNTLHVLVRRSNLNEGLFNLNRNPPDEKFGLTFQICRSDSGINWYDTIQETENNFLYEACEPPLEIERVVHKSRTLADGDADANGVFQTFKSYYEPGFLTDPDTATPYKPRFPELRHFFFVEGCFGSGKSSSTLLRSFSNDFSTQNHKILFDYFGGHWASWVGKTNNVEKVRKYGKQIPFHLVAKEHVPIPNTESEAEYVYRRYRPFPDVALYKNGFPYFFCELDSLSNRADKYRMCVQMACALRFGHYLRGVSGTRETTTLFLMGAFVNRDWVVNRYFAFFDHDGKTVKLIYEDFNLRKRYDCAKFISELYNFAEHVAADESLKDIEQHVEVWNKLVKDSDLDSLYSKHQGDPGDNGGGKDAGEGQSGKGSKRKHSALADELERSGYSVYDRELELFEASVSGGYRAWPAHVVEAYGSKGKVVAKLIRKDSNEVKLLKELLSRKSRHNHVIPLLDTIESHLGPIIILPRATSLPTWLASHNSSQDRDKEEFTRICRQLVEGIAFIHRHRIAHLDIKPSNLVYAPGRLYIIDFDLAMRCEDIEDTTEICCGTPNWAAPEIILEDEKLSGRYSPIRADLWSCGKVLQFICEQGAISGVFPLLQELLTANEPKQRPLLHELVDEEDDFWESGRLLEALKSQGYITRSQWEKLEGNGGLGLKRHRDDDDGKSEHFKVQKLYSAG